MRFLTARWEHLILLNYAVPAAFLAPLVPKGTELDPWEGETLISLVGLHFADTRVLGLPFPGHRNFAEVNLRFYVRRHAEDGSIRRAVVFIRELVPRRIVAAVARRLYNEPYLAVPMTHHAALDPEQGGTIRYSWRFRNRAFDLGASVQGASQVLEPGSEVEFVTEHYWGYTRQRDGGTLEYEVEHPRWRVWTCSAFSFEGQAEALYCEDFGRILAGSPRSAYAAVGSPVIVRIGRRIA